MINRTRTFCGDCFLDDGSEFRFETFTLTVCGDIVAKISGNCPYGPYSGEIRMVRLDGIYHGQGNITYSGHSDHSFTMSILELTIDSSCHIAKGIWRENGMVDHFQGDLELVFSN